MKEWQKKINERKVSGKRGRIYRILEKVKNHEDPLDGMYEEIDGRGRDERGVQRL